MPYRICANEPSCEMIDMVPPEKRTLQVRNCMCDRDCITYADCCLDSKYYNRTHQNTEKLPFHCSLTSRVSINTMLLGAKSPPMHHSSPSSHASYSDRELKSPVNNFFLSLSLFIRPTFFLFNTSYCRQKPYTIPTKDKKAGS